MVGMVKMCWLSPLASIWLPLALLASALGAAGCSDDVGYADGTSQANPLDAEESAVVVRLNELRAGAGVATVKACASLNVSASAHSDDMRDKSYLKDVSPDGSTTLTRACNAGYKPACNNGVAMAEQLASGHAEGALTFAQWSGDANTAKVLTDPQWGVVGVGRSMSSEKAALWTLDLATAADPSCETMP
jgi:uncharacterized protein YkwD